MEDLRSLGGLVSSSRTQLGRRSAGGFEAAIFHQWGRDPMVAERIQLLLDCFQRIPSSFLQWGHDPMVVEDIEYVGFNGLMSSSPGVRATPATSHETARNP